MTELKKYHWGFIGMSGIGKSYWTKQLSQIGFATIDCDTQVIAEVSRQANLSFSTLSEAGTWLQLPYNEGFNERQSLFMDCEKQVLQKILNNVLEDQKTENTRYVIDMGGSAIYTGEKLVAKLKENLLLIYFDISEDAYEMMLQNYMANPCPVIWKDQFKPKTGETIEETLKNCYANLIQYRRKIYLELADIVIPYEIHRQANWKAQDFLAFIAQNQKK